MALQSTIDSTKPVTDSDLSSSVIRSNFAAAKADMDAVVSTLGTTSNVTFRDITMRHLVRGSQTAPTLSAIGSVVGTSGSVQAISGTDTLMYYLVHTGTDATGAGTIVTITYNAAFATAPQVIVLPYNGVSYAGQTWALMANASTCITATTSKTAITLTTPTGLTPDTDYGFTLLVIG